MNLGNLGWAGIGNMGRPMVERILGAGYHLAAYNPRASAESASLADGDRLTVVDSLPTLASRCETVFLSLPSIEVVRDVTRSLVVTRESKVRLVVNTGTTGASLSVELAELLQAHGARLVDCPVSGGPEAARAGVLSVMVSGAGDDTEALRPLLLNWGKSITVAGTRVGAAQTLKLVNNAVIVASYVSTLEAFLFGAKAGLDPSVMLEAMNAGRLAHNGTTRVWLPEYILAGRAFGARMHLLMKDMGLAMEEGARAQVPMHVCESALQVARRACEQSLSPEADLMDLMQAFELECGFSLPRAKEQQ